MSIGKEFKEFAMRGNVVDMAVGIIIGAAFGKIISSFVTDVLMPPLGMLVGGTDFRGPKNTAERACYFRRENCILRSKSQLWELHTDNSRFSDHRVRHLHHDQDDEPVHEKERSASRTGICT